MPPLNLRGMRQAKDASVTVILCAYNRPYVLDEQIAAIKAQSVKVKDIWLWYNQGSDDLIVDPHKHHNSLYSAVYYPLSIDGQLKFLNPANSLNYKLHGSHLKTYDRYNSENWTEPVRTGELLIFKSGLFHWALPSKYDRYSVAYNTEVVDA